MNGDILPFSPFQLATKEIKAPALFLSEPQASKRFWEFFTANIRNPHTRKAYAKAAGEFAAWCERVGIEHLLDVQPVHVAGYVEGLQSRLSAASIKAIFAQTLKTVKLRTWVQMGAASPKTGPSAD